MFKVIDDQVAVAAQITAADVARAAEAGFSTLVNNRPDGEAADQPPGAEIAAAAVAAGLDYHYLPIGHGGFSMDAIEALRRLLDRPGSRMLAFCRSGTRSTHLWALAAATRGEDPGAIVARASAAGYDLSALEPTLRQLAASATQTR